MQPDGRLHALFRLWDVLTQQQVVGVTYTTLPETGAASLTRSPTPSTRRSPARKAISTAASSSSRRQAPGQPPQAAGADGPGRRARALPHGRANLVLTPRFSPTKQESSTSPTIARTSRPASTSSISTPTSAKRSAGFPACIRTALLARRRQRAHHDDAGRRQFRHLLDGPRYAHAHPPDAHGRHRCGSLLQPGRLPDRVRVQAKRHPAALCHERGRLGPAADQHRQGRFATPVWSPRGDLIAFTQILGGQFHIGTMRPDGTRRDSSIRPTMPRADLVAERARAGLFQAGQSAGPPRGLFTRFVAGQHHWRRTAPDRDGDGRIRPGLVPISP